MSGQKIFFAFPCGLSLEGYKQCIESVVLALRGELPEDDITKEEWERD